MKRITVLALTLAALTVGGATQAFGMAQVYLQPCTTTAAVGTQFTVLVNLRDNGDSVSAWQYLIRWDKTLLRCDSIVQSPYLSRNGRYYTLFLVDTTNTVSGAMVGEVLFWVGTNPCAYGDGNLAKMVFFVIRQGSCVLEFDPSQTFLADQYRHVITVSAKNGYFQNPSGAEEGTEEKGQKYEVRLKATPNPFITLATIQGHEKERFALYDIAGRKMGVYKGDRIGEGLAPGVYFLRSEGQAAKPLRLVKLR